MPQQDRQDKPHRSIRHRFEHLFISRSRSPQPPLVENEGEPTEVSQPSESSTINGTQDSSGSQQELGVSSSATTENSHPAPPPVTPVPKISSSVLDTATDAAGTFIELAKDITSMFSGVPYVQGIAGIASQIFKIRDEVSTNKEECETLIDKAVEKSELVLINLKKLKESPAADRLKDMESDLRKYEKLLNDILDALNHYTSTTNLVSRVVDRKQFSDKLRKLHRLIDGFDANFQNSRAVDILIVVAEVKQALQYQTSEVSTSSNVVPQAQNIKDHEIQANVLEQLGNDYVNKHELSGVEELFIAARDIYHGVHDLNGEARSSNLLGNLYMENKRYQEAQESFENSRVLYQQAQNIMGEAFALQKTGELRVLKSEEEGAEQSFKTARELYRQVHSIKGEAKNSELLGNLYMRANKHTEAEESFRISSKLYREVEDANGEAYGLQKIGEILGLKKDYSGAEENYKNARDIYHRIQSLKGEAKNSQFLGLLFLQNKRLAEAEDSLDLSRKLYKQAKDIGGEAFGLQKIGEVRFLNNDLGGAEEAFKLARELYHGIKSLKGEGKNQEFLGRLYRERNRLLEAEEAFKSSSTLYKQAGDARGEAFGLRNLGEIYILRQKSSES